jgi:hypothetical protein
MTPQTICGCGFVRTLGFRGDQSVGIGSPLGLRSKPKTRTTKAIPLYFVGLCVALTLSAAAAFASSLNVLPVGGLPVSGTVAPGNNSG